MHGLLLSNFAWNSLMHDEMWGIGEVGKNCKYHTILLVLHLLRTNLFNHELIAFLLHKRNSFKLLGKHIPSWKPRISVPTQGSNPMNFDIHLQLAIHNNPLQKIYIFVFFTMNSFILCSKIKIKIKITFFPNV